MIGNSIRKLRTDAKMTQAQFSEIFAVSQQAIQKWESGTATPELEKIIMISKYFGVSLDALILDNDNRVVEEMAGTDSIKPQYQNLHHWDFYAANLLTEYQQSVDEGLDIENYKDVFHSVSRLENGEIKKRLGDVLFDVVINAKTVDGYAYLEPSELNQIKALRKNSEESYTLNRQDLEEKIHGAWVGRICGCLLGKCIEGIRTSEFTPFLKESNNYPLHRYIYKSDITSEVIEKYTFPFNSRNCYADEVDGMPTDDDTNYVVLAQKILDDYGADFTPYDVSKAWLNYQKKNAYCTAERVAFRNFVNGFIPPHSAIYQNPYREWIGAQIRGDYFGYINPANPELAAEMAWRDASISHVKNGIYGEMFISAMLAVAATTSDIEAIILGGLAQIPYTSRLYEAIMLVIKSYKDGMVEQDCFKMIHERYDENTSHGWCHTISNAMIVAASLLYGNGDFSKSICMAVEAAFDTDCNGATVGSVLGMANGIASIPEYWQVPLNDKLHTSIFGVGTVKITDCVKHTMEHVEKYANLG